MPQNTPSTMRVVPTGQIYRQLFDAQFQLSQSLSLVDSKSRAQYVHPCKSSHVTSLPLIRLNEDEVKHGILTSRQKSWVKGLPNDPYTENPVLYKQYSDYLNQQLQETNISQAEKEVFSLPDDVVPAKQDSDVVERVTQSKRQRHEAALEDMQTALTFISLKMEKVIEELSAVLQNKFARSDAEIAHMLASIEKDKDLKTQQMSNLCSLWEKIEKHGTRRQQWIASMNSDMQSLEINRMNKIREVFTTYGKTLQNISYLLLPDLQRLLDRESQKINQTILSNYRSYADLYVRLTSVNIERERAQHYTWLKKVEDWRILNTRVYVEEFNEFLKTEAVASPASVEIVKTNLLSDLKMLNSQRLELINTLCDMQPPNSTKSAVQKWRQDLKELSEELDNVVHMHLSKLHEEYEQVCKMCLEKVDNLKHTMIEAGVCSSHTASQVVDEFMLPLVGKQQREFEQNLDNLQKRAEEHIAKVEEAINVLYKFAKGAAHLWDVHENGLAKREKELYELVDKVKIEHDKSRQEQEAQLDSDLDRMRQGASEMALKESLVRVLTLLEKIKESYETAFERQVKTVQNYPAVVNDELNSYDQAVCHYFSLLRVVPSGLTSRQQKEMDETEKTDEESEKAGMKVSAVEFIEVHLDGRVSETPTQRKEKIITSKGTEFYILQEDEASRQDGEESKLEDEESKSVNEISEDKEEEEDEDEESDSNLDPTFLTEVKDEETDSESLSDSLTEFVEAIDIPVIAFSKIRDIIRMNFMEHLENWCDEANLRANTVVITKVEELNGELDLRLHLHQPRPRRVELDVHNVRAAELVLHTERITRHCSGVTNSLTELGSKFKALSLEHIKMAHQFEDNIQSLEDIFIKATKSARLVKLQNQVAIELDKFMTTIRTSLRQFRQHLDETLIKLKRSNAKFIKSFKLFSDGGNFCPEEIEVYRKKLDRMSLMIDGTEGSIMSELESVESKYLDAATKTTLNFEDRFKSHMSDLIFMECITHSLTNIQVKIKAEVAKSNMQAQKLSQMLKELQERLAACSKPSLDKEPVTTSQFNDSLADIFKMCVKRSIYLHCRSISKMSRDESPASVKDGLSFDGKASKPLSDPSAGIIKKIFKSLEVSKNLYEEQRTQAQKKEIGFSVESEVDTLALDWEKNKSRFQESPRVDNIHKASLPAIEPIKDTVPRKSLSGKSKLEKKHTQIGEVTESHIEEDYFLGIIGKRVKEILEGLVTTAEVYYNQKGMRQITRPQAIPETCEQCQDILSLKLQSYYSQADAYHNQCVIDFRGQLIQLEQLCVSVPGAIFGDLFKTEITQAKDAQNMLAEGFQAKLSYLSEIQKSLENQLRPTLGHPQRADDLVELCAQEKKWRDEYTELVMQHVQERQECALEHARVFLEKLVEASEQQLHQYDNMLMAGEVTKGRAEPKPQTTHELIRLMKVDRASEEIGKDTIQVGRTMWTGIPSNQLFIGEKPSTLEITATVQTYKSTLAHSATVEARDKAYADYKKYFDETLQQIEEMRDKLLTSQKNWDKSWESSVKKIVSLYQKEE